MSAINRVSVFILNDMIHVRGYVDGKRQQRSTKKKNTKANLDWVKRNAQNVLLQNIVTNEPKDIGMPTVEEFGYKSLQMNKSDRVKNTTIEYTRDFKSQIIPYFGSWKLDDIRPSDLREWQSNLRLTSGSSRVINIRNVFRGILQDAFNDELIDKNPFDRVKRPKKRKSRIFPFTLDEVHTLIKNEEGWFKNYLKIAFFTGMRPGELIALRWEDIDFDAKTINIRLSMRRGELTDTKTENSIRDIDMLDIVETALKEQQKITGGKKTVFVTQYGSEYKRSDKITSSKWKPILKLCNISYRELKKTRHSFASIMIQNGEEIAWVSKMLGHANIYITLDKYTEYIPRKDIKRATFLNNKFND